MVETASTEHMFPVDLREQRHSLVLTASDTRPVVVVLGMHRSGTSLCSHVLSALGVEMIEAPPDLEIAPSNAKGHWERVELRELQDCVLERFNRSYYGPCHDLPLSAAWWADPEIRPVRDKMLAFMRERMPNRALFGFKDPRTARLLPLWRHIFHELGFTPKVVLCLRNPAQVARSLAARDGLDPGIGEYRWFAYMTEVFRHSHDWEICTIEYEDWFPEPMTNVRKLIRFLGLAWDDLDSDLPITAAAVVDSRLRHEGVECGEARNSLLCAPCTGWRAVLLMMMLRVTASRKLSANLLPISSFSSRSTENSKGSPSWRQSCRNSSDGRSNWRRQWPSARRNSPPPCTGRRS
jgi:hypothetical protein